MELGIPALFDISSEMTKQTNRLAKQCGNWKVSKFRITVDPVNYDNNEEYVALAGNIRYLKPTRGRIAAIKKGRSAWYRALKADGVPINKYHDFRVTPMRKEGYANNVTGVDGQVYQTISNLSTLDGVEALSCFQHQDDGYELFTTHNAGLPQHLTTTESMFSPGLITRMDTVTVDTDFVLEEEVLLPNHWNHADDVYTTLSFVAHYDEDEGVYAAEIDATPNLYFSLLNGWFEVQFNNSDSDTDGESEFTFADSFNMDVTAFVMGVTRWKRKSRKSRKGRKSKRWQRMWSIKRK